MAQTNYGKVALILGVIAAVLAFSAAFMRYQQDGEVRWTLIAGGAFMLALGLGARARNRQHG